MESVIKLANLAQTGKTRCVGWVRAGADGCQQFIRQTKSSYETLEERRPHDTEINFSEYFPLLDPF